MWSFIVRMIVVALRAATTNTVRVAAFGRIAFVGLIKNRPLVELTQQEIRNAFAKVGLREAHNSHFISRLVERGPQLGIQTLDDFARALNNGVARVGRDRTIEIMIPNGRAFIVMNEAGELITLTYP